MKDEKPGICFPRFIKASWEKEEWKYEDIRDLREMTEDHFRKMYGMWEEELEKEKKKEEKRKAAEAKKRREKELLNHLIETLL